MRRSSRSPSRRRSWTFVRSRVSRRRGSALAWADPEAAAAARILEAPTAVGRHDRLADGDVRAGLAGLLRRGRARGLNARRVRPFGPDGPSLSARAGLRAALQPQPQPLVLGH